MIRESKHLSFDDTGDLNDLVETACRLDLIRLDPEEPAQGLTLKIDDDHCEWLPFTQTVTISDYRVRVSFLSGEYDLSQGCSFVTYSVVVDWA
jgi:hypothetical protein